MAVPTTLVIDATQQTLEITTSRDAVSIQGRSIETGTPTDGEVLTYSTSASEWVYLSVDENVDDRVAALIQDSAAGGLTWTYDDAAGTLTPAYVGDSTLVTTGVLASGSIGSSFGNVDIGSSTLDCGVIASGSITSGFGTINTGSSAITGGAASFTTISGSTSLALATGATVTGVDDGSLGSSATLLATQGAIKTYVDAQVTAQDLDIITSSGNIDIDLDSESLTLTGGTGLASSATGTTVTFAIDSTVATLAGSQTLTNKTLTTPVISSISNTGTVTLPTSTDTLVGKATTDTLTNKSISGSTNTLSAIANGSLTNSTVAYGGVSLALGGADTTPAFNLSHATAYPGDSALVTVGTLGAGGSISSAFGNIDIGSSQIDCGTVGSGAWNGSVITGAYIDPTTSPLADTKLWIGSASNVAAEFALSGNATMTAGGVVTVSTAAACTGNAATATALQTARTIGGTSFDGTANIAVALSATTTALASARTIGGTSFDGTANIAVALSATATALATARAINGTDFDGTAAITVTAAASTLTGATLNSGVTASSLTSVGTLATGVWNGTAITGDYIDATSSPLANTKIWIGDSSGDAAEFALSGNATMTAGGVVTVSTAAACSGLSATATALATARAINGTDFDGTAGITITSAAGTLTGATLNSGVTASSLTSVGTLASLAVSGAVTASDDIDITADDKYLSVGAGSDARISYNGTHMMVEPQASGSGTMVVTTNTGSYPTLNAATAAIIQRNAATGNDVMLDLLSGNAGNSILNFSDDGYQGAGAITYDHTTPHMAFGVGENTEFMRCDAATGRRVGIGLTDAEQQLQVRTTGSYGFQIESTAASKNPACVYENSDGDSAKWYTGINIREADDGSFQFRYGTAVYPLELLSDGGVKMPTLPTSDPSVAGELWNDSGAMKISAG
jgi:hypothetical protein